jgi:hypothetical protein
MPVGTYHIETGPGGSSVLFRNVRMVQSAFCVPTAYDSDRYRAAAVRGAAAAFVEFLRLRWIGER